MDRGGIPLTGSDTGRLDWRVTVDADDATAYAALATDRLWNGYSIADLEPPFRPYARVALAARGSRSLVAACLILQHPSVSSVIPDGDPEGLAAILASVDLPAAAFLLARPHQLAVVQRYYRPSGDLQRMLRLAVDRQTYRPPERRAVPVERLTKDDLDSLLDLYAAYDASAFSADQLESGPFYGVRQDGKLLAAGGIHAVSSRHGIGAVGNFYTRPEERARGYAQAIASAVVGELLAGPCEDVILNVAAENAVARRLYARLGFRIHCDYVEGRVARR